MRWMARVLVGLGLGWHVAAAADPISFPASLPGTTPLTIDRPLDEVMVEGIDRFALREIERGAASRTEKWKRDFASRDDYEKSLMPYRERLRQYLGAVDPRVAGRGIEDLSMTDLTGVDTLHLRWTPFSTATYTSATSSRNPSAWIGA